MNPISAIAAGCLAATYIAIGCAIAGIFSVVGEAHNPDDTLLCAFLGLMWPATVIFTLMVYIYIKTGAGFKKLLEEAKAKDAKR